MAEYKIMENEREPLIHKLFTKWSKQHIIFGILLVLVVCLITGLIIHYSVGGGTDNGRSSNRFHSYNIRDNCIAIQRLMKKASIGKFDQLVWSILTKRPYLINVIPENTSYALLHYAAQYNKRNVVKTLAKRSKCDVRVQSAKCARIGRNGGKLARQLTSDKIIKDFLQKYTELTMEKRFGEHIPYKVSQKKGQKYNKYGSPLFLLTLSSFMKTFLGKFTVKTERKFTVLLRKVFDATTWNLQNIEREIINFMFGYDFNRSKSLNTTSEKKFYGKIINLYTTGTGIYRKVNKALRRQALFDYATYSPRSMDLHVGPYALMLQSILRFWKVLKPCTNITYRGVSSNITGNYTVQETFVDLAFMSSYKNKSVAEHLSNGTGSIFVINNIQRSLWQPLYIAPYSNYKYQSECLYPSGATFTVTDIKDKFIYLKLKGPGRQ